MGLVDLALEAALDNRLVRHGGTRARGHHQHRIGVGADQLQGLCGDAGVGAGKALGGHDLHAVFLRFGGDGLQPQLAVGVGVTQKADGLDALLLHQADHGVGHHVVALWQAEGPGITARWQAHRAGGQLHRTAFHRHHGHGAGHWRGGRANDQIHLVFSDKALGVLHTLGGVGGVIQDDQVDLLTGDGGRPELEEVRHRDAQARGRAGQGQTDADGHIGQRRHGSAQGGQRITGTAP